MAKSAADVAQECQAQIEKVRADFEFLDEWMDRYAYIIDLGKGLPEITDAERVDGNLVRGCQSQVWLVADPKDSDERVIFRADSDAHIVKGLVALVLALFSGRTVQAIAQTDAAALFAELGLDKHLSPSRTNGLFAMVGRIKALAQAA